MYDLTYVRLQVFQGFCDFPSDYALNFGYVVEVVVLDRLIKGDRLMCDNAVINIFTVVVLEIISMANIDRVHARIMLTHQELPQVLNLRFTFHIIQIIIQRKSFKL